MRLPQKRTYLVRAAIRLSRELVQSTRVECSFVVESWRRTRSGGSRHALLSLLPNRSTRSSGTQELCVLLYRPRRVPLSALSQASSTTPPRQALLFSPVERSSFFSSNATLHPSRNHRSQPALLEPRRPRSPSPLSSPAASSPSPSTTSLSRTSSGRPTLPHAGASPTKLLPLSWSSPAQVDTESARIWTLRR